MPRIPALGGRAAESLVARDANDPRWSSLGTAVAYKFRVSGIAVKVRFGAYRKLESATLQGLSGIQRNVSAVKHASKFRLASSKAEGYSALIDFLVFSLEMDCPMLLKRDFSSLLSFLLLFQLVGCGRGVPKPPVEKLVPAAGVIQLDGKPAAGVQIRLTPFGDGSAKTVGGAYATTGEDGKFKVTHWSNKEGITPGAYLIAFSKMVKPDGSPLGAKDSPAMVNAKETIAPAWSSMEVERQERTARRVEIPETGKTDIQFSITSAPKS